MTALTEELVDAKDAAVKAELRSEVARAVSEFLIALEKQGSEFLIALERQGSKHAEAIARQNTAIERQNAIIERQNAALDRRLATATYWMFGVMAAGHLATISVVIALVD